MLSADMILKKWPRLKFTVAFTRWFTHLLSLTAPAWGAILALIALLGVLLAWQEDISISDALYCTSITAMTVGYGDITPVTHLGRIIAVAIGILGIIASGIVVAAAIQAVHLTYKNSDEQNASRQD